MKLLWQSLTNLFSYLFMTSAFVGVSCSFYLVIYYLKDIIADTSETEQKIAKQLFVILLFCIFIFPLSFYISHKSEKKSTVEDKYDYTK